MPSLGGSGEYGGDDPSGGADRDRDRDRDRNDTGHGSMMERARRAASLGGHAPGSAGYARGLETLSESDREKRAEKQYTIDRQKYIDALEAQYGDITQAQRVRQVGTTEVPMRQTEAPYDYGSLGGLAEFGFDLMSGKMSGLAAVGQSLRYNKQRQDAMREKIMSDFNVDSNEAQAIMDREDLNITDIYRGAETRDVETRDGDNAQESAGGGVRGAGATGEEADKGSGVASWEDIFKGATDYKEGFPTTPEGSAMASLAQQEAQRNRIKELYAPFYEGAIDEALPSLISLITGEGDVDFQPSKLYEYQKEEGERNIKRTMAARGISQSSGARDVLEEFRSDLTAEESDRVYGGLLSTLQLGSGASGAVGAASRTLAGTAGSIFSQYGSQQAQEQINLGQSRQSIYGGLANTLSGLAQYMASR